MEKEKNFAVMKNNFVQNRRTYCLKVPVPKKSILKKWQWRNSEVCTNSEYTWIVQPIVWTLNPYEWKPRAQTLH